LRERPFRDFTVEAIMSRTGLKRPAFYAHFRDRYEVVLAVVAHVQEALFEMANRWLEGDDPERDVRAAFEGVVPVYVTHGHVLRALADAASSDERVQAAYASLIQVFVDATAEHIAAEQALGRTPAAVDAQETARALVLLNERYLSAALGGTAALGVERRADPAQATDVLVRIWLATLYGGATAAGV
jgi:AcrR family transcriptional regulator